MKMAGFIKGATMGLIVGAAAGIAMDPLTDSKRRKMKKNANRMMDNVMSWMK